MEKKKEKKKKKKNKVRCEKETTHRFVHVLFFMLVTRATFHLERSPLKIVALWNTAH